ncbi:PREDICTED: zinc finger protein 271-like [Nicrophorus vespilloides]|uniref:Zinc finger protein 271-like n=1 Tax=Nicrophorus vespilloides TaxID=110193 RepID=A0ABM1M523_NICVS|nr:PREDICTED: zinc finger protein 271-like [Nicrophorus vespilloides]
MEGPVLLCDSTICRLCGEENENGTVLFEQDESKENLSDLVNKYLPIKVDKDGKFPCTLCPGCTIQLEATKSFFDLIIDGQRKLRDLLQLQQETLKRQEKQKVQLEHALKIVNPSSSVQTYSLQSDETGEKIFIQILSEGPLFPPEHELSLRTEGLEKPKKKRGRPPKSANTFAEEEPFEIVEEVKQDDNEIDIDGKRKRRIKKPSRYSELLQGKELDRVFKEVGVFDEDEVLSDSNLHLLENGAGTGEVIGHMADVNGENLAQLVISKNANKTRNKCKLESANKPKEKYECDICGREFLHQGRLEIHKSFHKNIKYQCGTENCAIEFETKSALEGHQQINNHSGTTLIESLANYGQVELPQISENLPEILEETKTIDSPKPEVKYNCVPCAKTFSCKQNYEIHMNAVHENQKPYECDKCDKKFPYLNSLKCHMLQHTNKSYPCDTCEKVFNHPSSLVYHKEAEHNNGRKFICNKCKKCFKHKQLLLRHQLVHTNERPHVCKHCEASFKTRANLLNHMPTHTGEKKYYCTQCGQSFAHKTSLTLHTRWHNGQKPYQCDVCMKTFSQKGNLAEHKRIHTGEKPYACSFCGRKFTTSSQYKLHVKRHTGERPWRCEYCSKTFLHKDTWKCHTRRHRNERPYQCQQCLRGFTEHWALKKHQRLHTGEKPYLCDICLKSFADASNLTKHKKIHWNKNKDKEQTVEAPVATNTEQGTNQILYLAYQDGNSNEQPQTMVHIVDNEAPDKMPNNIFEEDDLIPQENANEMSIDVQLQQLIDTEGNAINLTTSDGQQIKVVTTIGAEEPCIQGLLPDGTLVPINLTMQDGKPISAEMPLKNKTDSLLTDDLLQENIQLLEDDNQKLQEDKIQFLTEDGQNVCFITTYIDSNQLNNQYIGMP